MIAERLYIPEIQIILHYRRTVSVRDWGKNNGVRVLCDFGSNKQFVLKDEFENAINRSSTIQGEAPSSMRYNSQNNKLYTKFENEYKSQGAIESRFLSILLNSDSTL